MIAHRPSSLLPPDILAFIEECKKKPNPESYLIAILHKIQGHFGYLDLPQLNLLSELLQVPTAKISGVASFYHYFRLKPRGKFVITVCTGTACHVKGADLVIKRLKEELQIEVGETTKNGLFTLETARCLGMCALAPVVKVGEKIYPQVTPDQIPAILESYTSKEQKRSASID